jgi:SOS response regulatory protein OraA/RecX
VSSAEAAYEAGVRALARRELTRAELSAGLQRAGFGETERDAAIDRLRAAGYLDDSRATVERARVLADRGFGDAAIVADLTRRGASPELIGDALAGLELELDRARRIAIDLGGGSRSLRRLGRKGFSEHSLEVAAMAVAEDL